MPGPISPRALSSQRARGSCSSTAGGRGGGAWNPSRPFDYRARSRSILQGVAWAAFGLVALV